MDTGHEELECLMTDEERELYDSYRNLLGKPITDEHTHDLFYPLLNDGDVRLSLMQKWATMNADYNALWFDEEYARQSRWGGIIAPPLFLLTLDDGTNPCAYLVEDVLQPSPNPTLNLTKYPTFRGVMQISSEWEFLEPLRPGDFITWVSTPSEIYWRSGQRFRLLFLWGETVFSNQADQTVARSRVGGVYMFKWLKQAES